MLGAPTFCKLLQLSTLLREDATHVQGWAAALAHTGQMRGIDARRADACTAAGELAGRHSVRHQQLDQPPQ